jgi:hypothetical protein
MPSTDHQQPLLSVQPAVTIKPVGNVFPVVYSLCAISLFLLYIFRFRYPSDFILWILFGLLSFPVSLLLHSIGHLLMGKLFGGKFLALNCGCIRIAAKTDRLRFEPRRSTDGRGCCYMHFSSALSPVRRLLFHGGGALINFLSAALCYLVSYFPLSPPGELLCSAFTLVSLLNGLKSLYPDGDDSDSCVIWGILLQKPYGKRYGEYHRCHSQLVTGVRPRDLVLPGLSLDEYISIEDYSLLLLYYWRDLDAGNRDGAAAYLSFQESPSHHIYDDILAPLCYELCFFSCLNGDYDKAVHYHNQMESLLSQDHDSNGCRIRAYYAFYIEKDTVSAARICQEGLEAADDFPIKGQAEMERDLLTNLLKQIENGVSSGLALDETPPAN